MIEKQREVVEALMKSGAYDENVDHIDLIQTHISFVFLTDNHAYKVKKGIDLGFLDFTTLEKRRFYCEKELELNRLLCGDMYLEVVPINKSNAIKIKGKGETVEFALKMKRMPQDKMLSVLLEKNEVDKKLIDKIAKTIAKFHSKSEKNTGSCNFKLDPIVETNWKENFDQTAEFVGKTISKIDFKIVHERIEEFMKQNMPVFLKRMKEGRVKNCHGDIHSGNIFVKNQIFIFDAIEFNERISYSDVAADIGFLAMDLDFKNRQDLSRFLVEKYIRYSGDKELTVLLPFYKCYRAYVRGKVISFKLKDKNVTSRNKKTAKKEATAYFKLASKYAKNL